MKKIIAYLLAMVMIVTTMSTCVISVSADSASVATTEGITEEIFTETFEDYTKDENWLDHTESSYVTGVVPEGKEKDWFIYDGVLGKETNKVNVYRGAADAEIMVVDAAEEELPADTTARGKVLKIYGGSGEAKDLTLRRTVESLTNMGNVTTYGKETSNYGPSNYISTGNLLTAAKNKKLVYEVRYYAPKDFYSSQASLMSLAATPNTSAGYTPAGGFLTAFSAQYAYMATMGDDKVSHYARAYHYEKRDGGWHTIKVVADYSDTANKDYWHTSRVYIDDKLVTAKYTTDPKVYVSGNTRKEPYLEGPANYVNANKTNGTAGDDVYDFAPYQRIPAAGTETETASAMKVGEMHGWFFGAKNSPTVDNKTGENYDGKALYYVDDIKAYWVAELEIGTVVNAENYKTGAIQIPFNSEIRESVTKYNPQYVNSTSNTSGYNTVTRFGENYTTTITNKPSKSTKTLLEVANAEDALITIVDKDNKLIEGAVKSVALSSDKKTVLVTPDMTKLSGNTEYKIALDPMFSDIYGQALTDTTTTKPVTNYVTFITASAEFTARVDKESISATEGDDEISATVTLSEVATQADLANAFTVTNTANNEAVTEGWSYTLSADGTKVELDFSNLAKGSYKLTMNEFAASGKPLSNASDIVISITIAEKLATDPLFNETFEDYTKDVNWISNVTKNFVTSANTGVKENDWYIASKYSGATDAQVMVVDAGDKGLEADGVERGNILMIYGGKDGSTMLSLQKTVNNITNAGEVKDNYITYGKLIEEGSKGRKLVYEVDFYRPTDFYTSEAHFMTNSASLAPGQYLTGGSGFYTSLTGKYTDYIITMGESDYSYYARAQRDTDNRGAWHNMKVVIDYTAENSATYWNTARVYLDGVLVTAKYAVKAPNDRYVVTPDAPYELEDEVFDFAAKTVPEATRPHPAKGDFYGWVFSAKNGTTYNPDGSVKSNAEYNGKAVYYIDNFKSYWVDALEAGELVNGENYVSGEIEIPFNSEIKENITKYDVVKIVSKRSYLSDNVTTTKNYKDLIYVVDEKGDKIEGALSDIRLSDNKRSLIVTPDMNVLWGGRKYKIAIDPLFTDVFGQAFTGNTTSQPKTTYVEFTTAKNNNLSIKSATNAIVEGNTVSTTIELSNVAATSKTAFLAVAVYNSNHEMIGITTSDVTVGASQTYSAPVTVNMEGYSADDVAFVKAHLWTSFEDMIAYQAAENIGL